MKRYLSVILCLTCCLSAFAQISSYPENQLDKDDAIYVLDDPNGTPANAKITIENLREHVNVKDYGALGDGSDDSEAFQDAFDAALAAGGGTIFIPPGHYLATVTLDDASAYSATLASPGVAMYKIKGSGAGNTIWEAYAADANALTVTGDTQWSRGWTISDLTFFGNDRTKSGVHINDATPGVVNLYAENVNFFQCDYGFRNQGSLWYTFNHCSWARNNYGTYIDGALTMHGGCARFVNCNWYINYECAVALIGSNGYNSVEQVVFDQCINEGNPGFGFFFYETNSWGHPIVIRDCYWETTGIYRELGANPVEAGKYNNAVSLVGETWDTPVDLWMEDAGHVIVESSNMGNNWVLARGTLLEINDCDMGVYEQELHSGPGWFLDVNDVDLSKGENGVSVSINGGSFEGNAEWIDALAPTTITNRMPANGRYVLSRTNVRDAIAWDTTNMFNEGLLAAPFTSPNLNGHTATFTAGDAPIYNGYYTINVGTETAYETGILDFFATSPAITEDHVYYFSMDAKASVANAELSFIGTGTAQYMYFPYVPISSERWERWHSLWATSYTGNMSQFRMWNTTTVDADFYLANMQLVEFDDWPSAIEYMKSNRVAPDATLPGQPLPSEKNVRAFGAVGDGTTDDTTAIQAAENAADDNSGILYFPPGTYALGSTVTVSSNVRLVGSGPSSIIHLDFAGAAFTCSGGGDVTFTGLTIDGQSTGYGMSITAGHELVGVYDCNFVDCAAAACIVSSSQDHDRIEVVGNSIRSSLDGFYFSDKFDSALFADNDVNGLTETGAVAGIHLGNNTSGDWDEMTNAIVRDNVISNVITTGVDSECHAIITYGQRHSITGNKVFTVYNNSGSTSGSEAIYSKATYLELARNVVCDGSRSSNGGICVKSTGEASITNNHIYTSSIVNTIGIYLDGDNITATNNWLDGLAGYGISLGTSDSSTHDNIRILDNLITGHVGNYCIVLDSNGGDGVYVIGNQIVNFISAGTVANAIALAVTFDATTHHNYVISGNVIESYEDQCLATTTLKGMYLGLPDATSAIAGLEVTNNYINLVNTTTTCWGVQIVSSSTEDPALTNYTLANNVIHVDGTGGGDYPITFPSLNESVEHVFSSGTVLEVTAAGPTNNVNVSGVAAVAVNTNGNNVTIGGFAGGIPGQILYVYVSDATNNAVLENNEGGGSQDILLSDGADETITAGYGGWILKCIGADWVELTVGGGGTTSGASFTFTDEDASPDAAGMLKYDNTVTGFFNGALTWHDGTGERWIVDINTAPSDDDYVVAYDADLDIFYMKADAGAGAAGTVTTVEDGDVQVGGADIVTLDFDGTVFAVTEDPDTEINIDIADDGVDSAHYAADSIDNEHINWADIDYLDDEGLAVDPGQVLTVAKSGNAQYSVIQTAIDAIADNATDKRYIVLIHPGVYTENVVMEEYVSLIGFDHETTEITSTSGTTLTLPGGASDAAVANLKISSATTDTDDSDVVVAINHADSEVDFYECYIQMTSATNGASGRLVDHDNGTVDWDSCKFSYVMTGSGAADAVANYAYDVAGTSTYHLHNCSFDMDSEDVDDILVCINEAAAATITETYIRSCIFHLTANNAAYAGNAGIFYLHGAGIKKEVQNCHMHVSSDGDGNGYIIYMDTTGGAGVVNSQFNYGVCEGFTNNYGGNIAAGDTLNASFVRISAASGFTGAGTTNIVASSAAGAFNTTGAITSATTVTGTTSVVAPLFDAAGDEDMDYGSADVDDHTFTSDGGTVVLDGSVTASAGVDLGTSQALVGTTAMTIGNNGQTVAINSSDWDIDATGIMTGIGAITSDGAITGTSFVVGAADMSETDLEQLDGITPGTAAASKAVVLDASGDIATINSLTATTLVGALTGNADTASVGTEVTVTDNEDAAENDLIPFVADAEAPGSNALETDGDFYYTPSTGVVTATGFAGSGASLTGIFPADPDADRILMWDDDPGALVWTAAGAGDMTKAVYDSGESGGVDKITTVDSTYASDYVLLTGTAVGTDAPKTDGALTYDADAGTLASTYFSGEGSSLTNLNGENIGDNTIDEDSIDWGSGEDQVDLADIPGGTAGANTFNLSAATVILPARTAGHSNHFRFNIFNPNAAYDVDTQVCICPKLPAAITITNIEVSCDSAANEIVLDLKWADAFIGLANAAVIDELDTTSGVASISAGFDDADVASGKCIYVEWQADPSADITQVCIDITFDYD